MNSNRISRPTSLLSVRLLGILLILAVLSSALPAPVAYAATDATCVKNYTVVAGDTVSKIAFDNNITVQELAAANDLKDPYPLYVNQVLCIPGTTTTTTTTGDSTTTSSTKGPTFTAKFSGNYVTITTANFPTKSNFYVKTADGSEREYAKIWYKMGKMRTKKTGDVTRVFKLPKQARDWDSFSFCVKNAIDDAVLCKTFARP